MPAHKSEGNTLKLARRLSLTLHGTVQGVEFRPFVYRLETGLGLRGWVLNSGAGLEIEVEGTAEATGGVPIPRKGMKRLEAISFCVTNLGN